MKIDRRLLQHNRPETPKFDPTLQVGDLVVLDDEITNRRIDRIKFDVTYSHDEICRHEMRSFGIWQIVKLYEREGSSPLAFLEIRDTHGKVIEEISVDLYWCHRVTREIIEFFHSECKKRYEILSAHTNCFKQINSVLDKKSESLFIY